MQESRLRKKGLDMNEPPITCTVRAAVSVWKLIQRPEAVVRRRAIASGESVSSSERMRAHASLPMIDRSCCTVISMRKSSAQLLETTPCATSFTTKRVVLSCVLADEKARCARSTRARSAAHAAGETQENAGAEWWRGGRAEEEP